MSRPILLTFLILTILLFIECAPSIDPDSSNDIHSYPIETRKPIATDPVPLRATDTAQTLPPHDPASTQESQTVVTDPSKDTQATINEVEVEILGQIGGMSAALALQGKYAYIGSGPRIMVLDVSDPEKPVYSGLSNVLVRDTINNIRLVDSFAFATTQTGNLLVLNLENPVAPQIIGFLNLPGPAEWLTIADDYAYIANGTSGVAIVDVSNSTSPEQVNVITTSGIVKSVAAADQYLYVTEASPEYLRDLTGSLRVFDIADPAKPLQVGKLDMPYFAQGISVIGDYAYLACAGLCIVDISNAHDPRHIGFYEGSAFFYDDIAVVGEYAFIAENQYCDVVTVCPRRVSAIDVTDRTHPEGLSYHEMVESWRGLGEGRGLVARDSFLYIATVTGLVVMDARTLTSIGEYHTTGIVEDIAVSAEYAYIVDGYQHMHVVDLHTLIDPQTVTVLRDCGICTQIVVFKGHAYVDIWDTGVGIIDVQNPREPAILTRINMLGGVHQLAVEDHYLFVVHEFPEYGRLARLRIFDIENPAQPLETGSLELQGAGIRTITIIGRTAYVGSEGRLEIIDLRDISQPRAIGELTADTHPANYYWSIGIDRNYAVMVKMGKEPPWPAEMLLINLSDTARPRQISTLPLSKGGSDVAIAGDYVFALGNSGLSVIDISYPLEPREVGVFDLPGERIQIVDDTLYVAAGKSGLWIFSFIQQ